MPDEARDGRNVALNLTSVHGVLDCPKKNQASTIMVFVLVALIVMPHRAHALSSAFTMTCSSLVDSATRLRSSAY